MSSLVSVLKQEKGVYGYINKQRVIEIIKTVIMFACAIGLYLIGYLTLKTNKSLWTIFAVLSVLPAAKSCVSMIMFIRFSSISSDDYNKIRTVKGSIPTAYEYVFTTSEKAYFVKACSCVDSTIIALYDCKAKFDNSNELKEHMNSAIEREGLKGYSLKIYTKMEDYLARLHELEEKFDGEADTSAKRIFALFDAITI